MNILLAFKAEPDLSMLAETDWQVAGKGNKGPDASLMRRVIGNDELGAGEIMLRARDRHPGVHLSAITLGDEHAMPILRHLKALGFERCVRLNSETDTRFAPAFVAERISRYIRQNAIDLVLLGTQSCEGQNGQTGWMVAEMLNWPCLTQVTEVMPGASGFDVLCESLRHRQRWQLQHPAVLMVQNRGQMALRVPGLRARMSVSHAEIECIEEGASGVLPSHCLSLQRQPIHRAGVIIQGGSVQDNVQQLWQDYLAERMK